MAVEPGELSHEEFLRTFEHVFEGAPWIVEKIWDEGLDGRHETAAGMHTVMCNELRRASDELKLEILRAQAELAVTMGGTSLTATSRREQKRSGLDRCSPEETAEFQRLNQAYRDKFGFPFILAIKGFHRRQILDIFHRRLDHSAEEEFQAALGQLMKIALFRLEELFA